MSGTGAGQAVTGFIANSNNPFDPVKNGYPTSNPTAGFTPKDEGFAGIIFGRPTGGGADLSLYCIDINTPTYGGIGYVLGTWDRQHSPQRGLRGAAAQRVLPEHRRTGRAADLTTKGPPPCKRPSGSSPTATC